MTILKDIENHITVIEDFPQKGVSFKDISPILLHRFPEAIDELSKLINWNEVEAIGGMESRGFIFAAALAQKFNIGFIPIRKKGKLPPPVHSQDYQLEYGSDTLEMRTSHGHIEKIVLVDDVIATGGTLQAAIKLSHKANLEVIGCLSLINLKFLNNFKDLGTPVHSLFEY